MKQRPSKHRSGYTLVELTFSLGIYTALVVSALVGFLGILGIYNKAQSLTRVQQETRKALDIVSRDLREARLVSPVSTSSSLINGYCLQNTSTGLQVAYGQALIPGRPGYLGLVRSESCNPSSADQLVFITATDVWTDRSPNGFDAANRSFVISNVTSASSSSKVWKVRVGAFRGNSAPKILGFDPAIERFNAGSIQEAIIVARGE